MSDETEKLMIKIEQDAILVEKIEFEKYEIQKI